MSEKTVDLELLMDTLRKLESALCRDNHQWTTDEHLSFENSLTHLEELYLQESDSTRELVERLKNSGYIKNEDVAVFLQSVVNRLSQISKRKAKIIDDLPDKDSLK
jgi:adenine-specific DNA methylase